VRAFLAGGVPEVMLHLRDLGLLHLDAMTVTGQTVGENLDWWQASERRKIPPVPARAGRRGSG
jgi:dihydroxyacid dehydratase/phosphogluconate dehydratase